MSHIQNADGQPRLLAVLVVREPELVAIITLPRNRQRLTDQFPVHKRAVNLSGVEELEPASWRFG
jgi:hypothetical protein